MNSQDSKSPGDSEPTQMLEVPDWLKKQRAMASAGKVSGPSTTPPPPPNLPPSPRSIEEASWQEDNRVSQEAILDDEATCVLETGILPSPRNVQKKDQGPGEGRECRPACEVDPRRAKPFLYQTLPAYTEASAKLSRAAAALLPGSVKGIETELSPAISEVLGRAIEFRWAGMGPGAGIREILKEQAIWMMGRLAPGKERMLVGISPGLYRAFLEGVDEGPGDAFAYGVALFMVTEVMSRLATILGWPAFVWSANPLSKDGLSGVLGRSGNPLEVSLSVEVDGRQESFRIWMPEGVVGEIRECKKREGLNLEEVGALQGLRLDVEMSVGRLLIRAGAMRDWGAGDVLVFQAHGLAGEEVKENHRPGVARLWLGDKRGMTGTMVWDEGSIGFQLEAAAVWSEDGGRAMGQDEKSLDVTLDETRLEVEVCVGTLTLSVGEVASLKTGQILTTGEAVGGPVSLRVKGAEVARGELVTVDGHLGVRILRARTG